MDSKKLFSRNPYKIILCLISCVLCGSAFPALKISYEELGIAANDMNARMALGGIRFFLSSIILFAFIIFVMKVSVKVSKEDFIKLLILGAVQTALYYFLFYNGLANTSGMKAAIIVSFETFFTIIVAHLLYANDKINSTKIIGILTGFAGVVFANWGKSFSFEFSFTGEGFLLITGLIGAFSSIYIKNYSEKLNPFVITAWQMFLGSIVMILVSYPKLQPGDMVFNTKATILLIYCAFLSAIAFSLWYALLKYNKAGEISLYRFTIPVSGAMLSAMFIPNEKFTLTIFIALVMVSAGVIVVNKKTP